jgi:hypothetical protein
VFEREDLIGLLLLGLCVAAGGVLVYSIVLDKPLRYTGPSWLAVALMVLFLGGVIYGLVTSARGRWPDPLTGRGRRWRWPWRRRDGEEG